jgi:hypothetical protein
MSSPTLQTLQEPILLPPRLCSRGLTTFPNATPEPKLTSRGAAFAAQAMASITAANTHMDSVATAPPRPVEGVACAMCASDKHSTLACPRINGSKLPVMINELMVRHALSSARAHLGRARGVCELRAEWERAGSPGEESGAPAGCGEESPARGTRASPAPTGCC